MDGCRGHEMALAKSKTQLTNETDTLPIDQINGHEPDEYCSEIPDMSRASCCRSTFELFA